MWPPLFKQPGRGRGQPFVSPSSLGLSTFITPPIRPEPGYRDPGPVVPPPQPAGIGAPVNTASPIASGTGDAGQTLSVTTGTWTGMVGGTFTYQWQSNSVNIGGATASTFLLTSTQNGSTVRCVVTASNAAGNASANSNGIAISGGASENDWLWADAATLMSWANGTDNVLLA